MTPIKQAIEVLERVWSETNEKCIGYLESFEVSGEVEYQREYERSKTERRVLTRVIENLREMENGNSNQRDSGSGSGFLYHAPA